ncbi:unnamed protein product [Phyllotreta striolata]|uniref:Uncharacterized protein n=1 Tax=Phyllotreta striolata TaxID=444603 RepID=A0A9N9U171_PHYSR|nr:unnamed protein product [Phyllotreta striolata]
MNGVLSPRPKKRKQPKDDMKEQIVAQVHKSPPSIGDDDLHNSESTESNRTFTRFEDRNENVQTPSREISVDGESQINSKIMSLIETEMRRDINRHSHFTDSRPQSLSFYEDEKVPEELSGNLELLSPEERKHYKKRKEYQQMDTDELNAYNAMQSSHGARDADDIIGAALKKSKSKKKRHGGGGGGGGGDAELGMGDSREMMIPKEKKKSKKKRRDVSPANSSSTKRKHKKREEEYDLRNDISAALEDLQDDVFESNADFGPKPEKAKKSPRKSDKLYVQRKSKFEVTGRPSNPAMRSSQSEIEDGAFGKRYTVYPLDISLVFQRWWIRISTLCHGLLGGLALGHWLYLICNFHQQDASFLIHYAYYSDIYIGTFFALCVLCIVSIFDRIDTAHLEKNFYEEILFQKRNSFVAFLYLSCLIIHLTTFIWDDQFSRLSYQDYNSKNSTAHSVILRRDINIWNHLSLWRSLLAFTAWIFIGLGPTEDSLYNHLKSLEAYLPNNK